MEYEGGGGNGGSSRWDWTTRSHGRGALMAFIFFRFRWKIWILSRCLPKSQVFYYCLNWITLCEFGIVSVSVTGSEMTDCELPLLAVVSRCWSMDSMIGSVCTQNVKWETHLKGEPSFYLLSVVCCSQKLCWTWFAGWFSWLVPVGLQWCDLFQYWDKLH